MKYEITRAETVIAYIDTVFEIEANSLSEALEEIENGSLPKESNLTGDIYEMGANWVDDLSECKYQGKTIKECSASVSSKEKEKLLTLMS